VWRRPHGDEELVAVGVRPAVGRAVVPQVEIKRKNVNGSSLFSVKRWNQARSTGGPLGSMWGQFGVNLGSSMGQYGVNIGSSWGEPMVDPGTVSCTSLPLTARRARRDCARSSHPRSCPRIYCRHRHGRPPGS
jgi:hypothetical protein